jgi:type III restriction enzyme
VEYKGDRDELRREQHKKAIGELWEARSGGRCRFAWIVDRNWHELDRKLAP